MKSNYTSWIGKDLGVMIGEHNQFQPRGLVPYKPINELILHPLMNWTQAHECFDNTEQLLIPYNSLREVHVNNQSVWKNKDSFKHIPRPYAQYFWGRGNVKVDIKTPHSIPNLESFLQCTITKVDLTKLQKQH